MGELELDDRLTERTLAEQAMAGGSGSFSEISANSTESF